MAELVEEDYDIDPVNDNLTVRENTLFVHNITAIADSGITFDLDETADKFNNAVYEPSEFKCIRIDVRVDSKYDRAIRLPNSIGYDHIEDVKVMESTKVSVLPVYCTDSGKDYTSVKVSLFGNGKLSVTGARSLLSAAVALEKVGRALRRRVNKKARIRNITCTNMLVVFNFGYQIVLQYFERACKGSVYDPLRFSGVRVRIPITSEQKFYTTLNLLQIANINGKYSKSVIEGDEDVDDDEEYESDSLSDDDDNNNNNPVIPNISNVNNTNKNYKILPKSNIQKFMDDFNNKRKIHQSQLSQPIRRKKNRIVTSSVWSTSNVQVTDKYLKHMKNEYVTVNVFTSGNITFTGARSISSVQHALSYIYPHLCSCKAIDIE